MKNLRILMLNDNYSELGGVEVLLNDTISILKKRGHDVFRFSFGDKNINKRRLVVCREPRFKILRYFNGVAISLKAYFRIKTILKNFKPDIIHLHNIDKHILTFLLPLKNNNNTLRSIYDYGIVCPTLWGIHKDDCKICEQGIGIKCIRHKCVNPFTFIIYLYLFRIKYYFQKKYIKSFAVATNRLRNYMLEQGFKNIHVFQYFTSKKSTKNLKKNKGRNLLFVGTLEKNKGCSYLIEAMSDIIHQIPDVHLTIIGNGTEEKNLKKLCSKLNLNKCITFKDRIPNNKIDPYYRDSSITVVPSIWMENSPIIIYECLSYGIPIIASNRGGNPELVEDGRNGFIIEPMNPGEISDKAIKLLKDNKLRGIFSKNALKTANSFVPTHYLRNLEKIYFALIKN